MRRSDRNAGARAVVIALVVATVAVPGVARGEPTLHGLLERFAGMPGLEASFRQEKHIGLLAAPLVNEGTLHFAPPDRMARRVRRPHRSALVVHGDRLRVREGDRTRSVDLTGSPMVGAFVESFRALLAGDRRALDAHFRLELRARPEGGWHLTMHPKDETLRGAIRRIEVEGEGVVLERLVVRETNGDRSVTTFSDVDPERRYTERELRAIFRLR